MVALTPLRLLALLAALAMAGPAAAGQPRLDPQAVIERSEAAIGGVVGDHVLIDSRGKPLSLSALRGKPLVVSLVYTRCASVCPPTTQHVRDMVARARQVLGPDSFAVLTFGFDARHDTPAQLSAFAKRQGIEAEDWHIASADAATVEAMLDDLGFSYSAAAGGFEHITQTTILDSEGRVYRHLYGERFPEQVFVEPLKELVFGTTTRSLAIGDLVDRIRFICTVYDPATGAYRFDYAILFGVSIGGFSLIAMGTIVFGMWRRNRQLVARRTPGQG
jgi:protein SCO1/2